MRTDNILKLIRIIYLIIGIFILGIFFFYSPIDNYSKTYQLYKAPASKVFVNKFSILLVKREEIYKCGSKTVHYFQYAYCWAKKYNKDPNDFINGYKITARDIAFSNTYAEMPSIIDIRGDLRDKVRYSLSILFFLTLIIFLWKTRIKFASALVTFYRKL